MRPNDRVESSISGRSVKARFFPYYYYYYHKMSVYCLCCVFYVNTSLKQILTVLFIIMLPLIQRCIVLSFGMNSIKEEHLYELHMLKASRQTP